MTIPGSVPPETVRAAVAPDESSGCVSFARPKSRIFTKPSLVTITFSGLRSRCTIPAPCAFARPSDACAAIESSAADRQQRRRPAVSRSVRPSTSSIAMYSTPSAESPMSWIVTMLG